MDEVRIVSARTFIVSLPVRRPQLWAGLGTPPKGYVVLKLELSNGAVGWGESQPIPTWGGDDATRYGETPATTVALIERILVPALADVDVTRFDLVHAKMDAVLRGYPYAKAAIDVAILDGVARGLNIPVFQLLGGRFRDKVAVAHSIGLMSEGAAALEAKQVVADGITTLKIKIGVEPERDVETVRLIREAVGETVTLRLDANQGYKNWRDAVAILKRMAPYNVAYAEQMVMGKDELAEVSRRTDMPIMADESVWTARDVLELARRNAAQYLSTYYTKPGGLWRARRLLTVAGACGMQSDINGSGEMGIGNAANVHLAAACPEITLAGTIPVTSTSTCERTKVGGRKYLDDIVSNPPEYDAGFIVVPNGPGLGISVDEDKIEKYRAEG
jgi:muconate cycloisomerase